jgi:hypothetical protein
MSICILDQPLQQFICTLKKETYKPRGGKPHVRHLASLFARNVFILCLLAFVPLYHMQLSFLVALPMPGVTTRCTAVRVGHV